MHAYSTKKQKQRDRLFIFLLSSGVECLTMSSSTTKKFREFMAEPLGDKGIRDVPGIGDILGAKLAEAGYEKVCLYSSTFLSIEDLISFQAYTLFGKYLLCNKDMEQFQDWIQTQCGANSHQSKTAAEALSEWAEAFI